MRPKMMPTTPTTPPDTPTMTPTVTCSPLPSPSSIEDGGMSSPVESPTGAPVRDSEGESLIGGFVPCILDGIDGSIAAGLRGESVGLFDESAGLETGSMLLQFSTEQVSKKTQLKG
jgi:hypothetical protein